MRARASATCRAIVSTVACLTLSGGLLLGTAAGGSGGGFPGSFLTGFLGGSARAQGLGLPDSAVLVIDPNRLFAETLFGKRVAAELDAESAALAAENRQIETELMDEEQALTDRRKTLKPQAFRAAADAFNVKVQRIRREQEQKAIRLAEESDAAQRRFLGVARPVLETMMRESGAAVMLDTRAVLLGSDSVDVTAEAVRRIDQTIGAGEDIQLLQPREPDGDGTGTPDAPGTDGSPPQQDTAPPASGD